MVSKLLNLVTKNKLLSGSLIVLVASTIANFGSYLFHLLMGRMLGPANYSVLESLIAIIYFLAIPINVFCVSVVKLTSQKKDYPERVAVLSRTFIRYGFFGGLAGVIMFIAISPLLKEFLKISSLGYFIGVGAIFYLMIFQSLFLSFLQGLMKFVKYGILTIVGSWAKIFIAVPFVYLGYRVGGAISAMVVGFAITVILGLFLLLREVNLNQSKTYKLSGNTIKKHLPYLLATLVFGLVTVSFFQVDVILARKFLSPVDAGYYSALSVLGKIIFFASSSVAAVMFPTTAEKHLKGENLSKILFGSLAIVFIISSAITLIYKIFPDPMIGFLYGSKFLPAAPNLAIFAVFICLYSLIFIWLNFFLSISKTKPIYLSAIFPIFQCLGIYWLHNSIRQIIQVNVVIMALLFLFLSLYYFGHYSRTIPLKGIIK